MSRTKESQTQGREEVVMGIQPVGEAAERSRRASVRGTKTQRAAAWAESDAGPDLPECLGEFAEAGLPEVALGKASFSGA